MNTLELENIIRDQMLEYSTNPFDSTYITRILNSAQRFAYNVLVKSNDTYFAQEHLLAVTPGDSEYDMPVDGLWQKRIEAVFVPLPPNQSPEPISWQRINMRTFAQTAPFQTSRIRTYVPECWSVLNNKFYLFPKPLVGYTARLIISRRLIPLGTLGGNIISTGTNTLVLDQLNDPEIDANKAIPNAAFISVCDYITGELKGLYSYNAVDTVTNTITLTDAPVGRTMFQRYPIATRTGPDFDLSNIQPDDVVTYGLSAGVSILGEAYTSFLTTFAVNTIRGVLNESDPAQQKHYSEMVKEIRGDLGGRVTGIRINRVMYNNITAKPTARR